MTINEYLDLITSAWREKPKFIGTVTINVSVATRVQDLLTSMGGPLFDIDVAVGQQLDFIGQWVGVSRNVNIDVNVYFSWAHVPPVPDDAPLGWNLGSWAPPDAQGTVTVLPDDSYRVLIKAKIAANQWDGTTNGAYAIWDTLFSDIFIIIQDHQDMSYSMAFIGSSIDTLTLALITGGYIPLKPEGVLISNYYVSNDDNPVFSWDVESEFLGGWDEASWIKEISPA